MLTLQGLSVLGLGNVLCNLRVLSPLNFFRQAFPVSDYGGFGLPILEDLYTFQVLGLVHSTSKPRLRVLIETGVWMAESCVSKERLR